MNSANIGWLFYRDYFNGLDYTDIKSEYNKKKIKSRVDYIISQSPQIDEGEVLGNKHFKATTTYPGLLLGSGNVHELPSVEGQAILGFYFDYTTGLPVIPGSSVKGVLRSAFEHEDYIRSLLEDDEINVKALGREIFGQENGDIEVSKGLDIFFDAEIISGSQIIGDDYLTPHGDGISEPVPLRFIKVMPGVTFMFDFKLHNGLISKEVKLKLFMHILEDLGIGAKTNVGYGKFDNVMIYQTIEEKAVAAHEKEEERYEEAIRSDKLDVLESFRVTYPKSKYLDAIDKKLAEVKVKNEAQEIETSFDNLDKEKANYVSAWIKKYENNPLAEEFIAQLQQDKGPKEPAKAFDLSSAVKFRQLEKILKGLTLTEDQKVTLEEHILHHMNDKLKKRRQFPFGILGDEKCLGKEKANEIADKLGL